MLTQTRDIWNLAESGRQSQQAGDILLLADSPHSTGLSFSPARMKVMGSTARPLTLIS